MGPSCESKAAFFVSAKIKHSFVTADAARLMTSSNLFARKFDADEDSHILALLENHVAHGAGSIYVPSDRTPAEPIQVA